MFLQFRIGIRYLLSKRRERFISIITWLAALGIAVSVMVLIVVISVMNGFDYELKEKILGVNAHMSIVSNKGIIQDYEKVISKVMLSGYARAASPVISGQVIVRIGDRITGVHIRGVDIRYEKRVTDTASYIKRGRFPQKGHQVLVGTELARLYNINAGDTIQIYSPVPIKKPSYRAFKEALAKITDAEVAGVFDSGMYEYDVSLIYVPLDFAQELFGLGMGVHAINVRLTDSDYAYLAKKDIKNILGDSYIVKGWMDMNKRLFTALQTEKHVMFILLVFSVLVAGINIISTLIMTVMEKKKDIGVLKAVGASNFSIGMIFVFLGFLIGTLGTCAGCACGLFIARRVDVLESWISGVFGYKLFPPDVYYFDKIPVRIDFSDVTTIVLCAIILSVLSAWYPAWRGARLSPVDAVRYE